MELSKDVNHRPIVFIRFNPDDYIKETQKIDSCWNINKLGVCIIKKQKINEWNDRLNSLKDCIDFWIRPENKTEKTIEIVELYYNS